MPKQSRLPFALLSLAFVSLIAGAAVRRPSADQIVEATSADRVHTNVAPSHVRAGKTGVPTDDEVGDSDSFGRNVRWLGLAAGEVNVTTGTCDPASTDPCQVLTPTGHFAFSDIARIQLPAGATHSLLCYWLSPLLTITYNNPTDATQLALMQYSPTVTVENPVLDDPTLIDPTTGAPFGGHLLTSMTSSQRINTPLPAGMSFTNTTRLSSVCIAGLVSRKQLTDSFGLSATQADAFFHSPTTLRLNVSGTLRYVSDAQFYFGLRIVGD
jgi:hypothetical protein